MALTATLLEENGHDSLIRDVPKLHRTFAWKRYRIDLQGFVAAWLLVVLFIAFYYWMPRRRRRSTMKRGKQ